MATNKLFSYSIEENDGKLVITVEGQYAQSAVKHLRSEIESGRGWGAISRLSPFGPLNHLSRQAALSRLRDAGTETQNAGTAELDVNVIFNQGFAETYGQFAGQLDQYGATLNQLRSELDANLVAKQDISKEVAAPPEKKHSAK